MFDIIIIGAGPIGLYTAKLLEKEFNVLVLEKRSKISGKACSGLISTNLKKIVEIKKDWIENEVKGCLIHSPFGKTISLRKQNTAAFVVNREKFDLWLSTQIKSNIMLNTKVENIEISEKFARVITSGDMLDAKMIIGCDGACSIVRKIFNEKPEEFLTGLIALTNLKDNSDFVEMWSNKNLVNDGFFWKIPRGEKTEYGLLGENVNFQQLESFFGLEDYIKKSAPIPLGSIKTYFNRALLLGDAACQVKPWSGGGVIYGMTCASIASEIIKTAFKVNNFNENFLKTYETEWKNKLGKYIRMGMLFRSFYKGMNNEQIEKVFEKIKNTKKINEMDMDFPSLSSFL